MNTHNKHIRKIALLLGLIVPMLSFGQNSYQTFNGNQYLLIGTQWKVYNNINNTYYNIVNNTITIKYTPSVSPLQRSNFETQNNLILIRSNILGYYDYQIASYGFVNPLAIAQTLQNSALTEDVIIPCYGEYILTPNDPQYSQQWYLKQSNNIDINIENAWNISTGSSTVKIGILDSGTDWEHEDLGTGTDSYQNIYLNTGEDSWVSANNPTTGNGIDDDGNGLIDDWKGWNFDQNTNDSRGTFFHGTHVAGIVGAKSNNGKGISGVAGGWNNKGCELIICNVGQSSPNGSILDDAIIYAVDQGAKIIQLSLTVLQSNDIDAAIQYAENNGTIVVCASGNSNSSVGYPASNPLVFSVGATDQSDSRASFSNFGSNLNIAAPGVSIRSTGISNTYSNSDGTSFAAPIISGTIGLMLSVNPCLSPAQIKDLLQKTADKVGGYNYNWNSDIPGHSKELGYGRLNAYKAVKAAQDMYSLALDLYIRDKPDDMGIEPNPNTQLMWTSKDIWIRNSDDNGLTHQNPEYKSNGDPNYIYVRVINKSCTASSGNEILYINWAKASTALIWPENWDGSLQNPGGYDLGGVLPVSTIPILQPGEETIVKTPWVVPNPNNYSDNNEPWHFCLLARIDGMEDPLQPALSSVNAMAINDNNVAWTNVTIVDLETEITGASVLVANPSYEQRTFFLELHKQVNEVGKAIFEEAEVSLRMDDILYGAWERGGKIAQNLAPTQEEKRKLVKGDNVVLDHVVFNSKEMGLLTLDFNFLIKEMTDKDEYTYHVVQKDANTGEVIGGETFIIRKKPRQVFMADAGNDEEIDKGESITLTAEQINEAAKYNWYDSEGNLIYSGTSLSVSPEVTEKYKLEVVAEADGFKDYDEVQVKVNGFRITSLSPNPANTNVMIGYDVEGANSAYLMIVGASNFSTSNNYILNSTQTQTNIDISNYQMGIYTVALVVDGQIVDAKALSIQ